MCIFSLFIAIIIVIIIFERNTNDYDTTKSIYFLINWGWGSQWEDHPVNDGWYSLTSGWTATNNGTYNYNHNIKIICNFAADE